MPIAFAIIAALTVVSAIAAMSLRNLVHCALCLALAFAGIAAFYLQLGAAFAGWAQVLVYIGAVAILIVFAILLTRSGEGVQKSILSRSGMIGLVIALAVFGILAKSVTSSSLAERLPPAKPEPTVRQIGDQLITRYVLPLEIIGLLLTAAAIGAVIIAMKDTRHKLESHGATRANAPDLMSEKNSGTLNDSHEHAEHQEALP